MPPLIDQLIRSKRKTLALHINREGHLIVRAPMKLAFAKIEEFVLSKTHWIHQAKLKMQQRGEHRKQNVKQFAEGETFLYLGKEYALKFHSDEEIILREALCFPISYLSQGLSQAKKYLIIWYQNQALAYISERAAFYAKITGWHYQSLKISKARTRWGSCHPRGSVSFSWRLILAPIEIIDYVIVHELAHLINHDHSFRFWNRVESILPDYKFRRKWLKEKGDSLTIFD